MTAQELVQRTAEALLLTDLPEWASPDSPDEREALLFFESDQVDDGPVWALAPSDSESDDYVPVDPTLACDLIVRHLSQWLLERGWQVQVTLVRNQRRWRLVDCLSIADGGGDRLDEDYPYGEDELTVLCESVVVVARQ